MARWSATIRSLVSIPTTLLVTSLLLAGCSSDGNGGATPTATVPPTVAPTPTSPPSPAAGAGLTSEIRSASIDASGTVTVTFTLTDAAGIPITPVTASTQNPQQARVRFTIAHVEEYSGGGEFGNRFTRYVNDINMTRPAYGPGTVETVDAARGVYRFTFNAKLPNANRSLTHSVGLQVDRTFQGTQLSANPVFDFVPAGGTPEIRAGSATEKCNTCHDPLILHGNRREFRLCTLCHTQAGVDELGRSIDISHMIHRIHRGKDLPSIVDGPPGSSYGIFSSFARSDVVFARKDENGVISGVGFPKPINDCETCHAEGETSHFYLEKPAAQACTGCHDDVNPSTTQSIAGPPGTRHLQNRGFGDGDCAFCHVPDTGTELDISVVGAHVIPERSQQLAGLNVEITGITNHGAGQTPTIAFKVTDDQGQPLTNLSGLNRVAFTISGPTTDYTRLFQPVAAGGGSTGTLSGPDGQGIFQYTPTFSLPSDATGTWAVGAEARRSVQVTGPDDKVVTVNEAAPNPVVTFNVDGSTALARRMVVDDAKCASCHGEFSKGFSIHGNLRNQVEYCVMCHNSTQSDVGRRRRDPAAVAAGDETATIDFKVMIHKIHTGEELNQKPYLIYGFGAAPQNFTIHDFAEVLFPGDRRNCATCHTGNSHLLPPYPGTAQGTRLAHLDPATGNEVEDGQLGPITSVCTSCHDGDAAAAHADTQTSSDGREACTVCHQEGREVAVSTAHAR
jgi:OmcA/MtrC family decaheme c-type cytochrome